MIESSTEDTFLISVVLRYAIMVKVLSMVRMILGEDDHKLTNANHHYSDSTGVPVRMPPGGPL